MATGIARWLQRAFGVEEDEAGAVVAGFAMFFLLFAGYFLLRPVRETMGIAGGVRNLQWLFTGTFLATLAAMPLFGWVAGRVRRRRIPYWVYGFFISNLLAFAACFAAMPGDPWVARTFYIWLSVFNLIAISVAWSVLVDVFTSAQSRRLFALIAAGASLGGLVGPMLGVLLVGPLGYAGLSVLSAGLLAAAGAAAWRVHRWRDLRPLPGDAAMPRQQPLGGSAFAGATEVLRSPYLMGIATFVLLLASVTTFLYFEQARLVEARFPDPIDQTRVFGVIDTIVQALAIVSQLFITGRVARTLGVGVLLVAVPLVVAAGFLWLAHAPVFAVLAVVMVARRAGEYAFVRPGREMLYTVVPPEAKYKAKNFNDTVVYRGADAVSGWVKAGIGMVAQQPAVAMVIGALIALAWAANGAWLARAQRRLAPH
ncbi:MAG: MFS transporter [Gammaproteobacteria bacterium]|nr:MFS transporter [Gammaproteobacteria bacterium]